MRKLTLDQPSGILHEYVRGREPLSHEEETRLMEEAVAAHVAAEGMPPGWEPPAPQTDAEPDGRDARSTR